MTPLLALAERLFGPSVRRDVFEPLLADRQRELANAWPARFTLRLRWAGAITLSFIVCTPRAFVVRMPTPLVLDVIGCAIALPLSALLLQWREIWFEDARYFGWRLVASLSFTVIPIVWRFRAAAIPEHQARGLTRSYVLVLCLAVLGLGYEEWPTRVAQVLGILWLALAGWRLADPNRAQHFSAVPSFIVKLAMVAACLEVASWPVKLALGIGLLSPYWASQEVLLYTMAWLSVVTLKKRFNGFTSIGP
jgi:hypothetical protein